MRNRLINGDMRIDQRNAGASQTITAGAALAYTVDRWYAYCTGANVTGQRIAGSGNMQNVYQFTGASSVTAIGFAQRIESVNCYDLSGTTATLSVYLSNSLLTSVTWTAYYATSTDTFGSIASPTKTQIATGTFTVTSSLTRYNTQISIPSAATTGIEIVFTVGAQTSGTWQIGAAQLERGTVATPYEWRHFTTECTLTFRYFQKSYELNTAVGTATRVGYVNWNWGSMATYGTVNISLPVRMRAVPNATNYSTDIANTVGGRYWNGSSEVAFTGSLNGFYNGPANLLFNMDSTSRSNVLFHWTAEAEL
jgi:hypothetical protein